MEEVSLFFIFAIFRQEWSSGLKTKKEIVLSKKFFGCFWLTSGCAGFLTKKIRKLGILVFYWADGDGVALLYFCYFSSRMRSFLRLFAASIEISIR